MKILKVIKNYKKILPLKLRIKSRLELQKLTLKVGQV